MQKRTLGQTGIEVSPLGLGTVKFGRDQQVKYPNQFVIPDDQAVKDLLALTHELGINVIDTAPAYGNSEERLGQLLIPHYPREDWVIVSKVGESFIDGQSRFDFSSKTTRKTVETSLKKLGTDYLDVVLVHSDGNDSRIIEQEPVVDTLMSLKREGLIRAVGMSTKTTEGGLWAVENTDLVMATRNMSDHTDDPVLDRALELNKGVVIKKGLQSGHAAKEAGGGGIEAAMRYVFSHQAVDCLITGTINPAHLKDNVALVNAILSDKN